MEQVPVRSKKPRVVYAIVFFLLLLGAGVFAGNVYYQSSHSSSSIVPAPVGAAVIGTYSIHIDRSKSTTDIYSLYLSKGESALSALQDLASAKHNFRFTSKHYSFGDLIVSIDNVTPDSSKQFWDFLINGKESQVGVSDYQVKKGDTLEFKLASVTSL